jgi:hypothetical protein
MDHTSITLVSSKKEAMKILLLLVAMILVKSASAQIPFAFKMDSLTARGLALQIGHSMGIDTLRDEYPKRRGSEHRFYFSAKSGVYYSRHFPKPSELAPAVPIASGHCRWAEIELHHFKI